MGIDFLYTDGQTPIDEDEKEGLLIKSISTRGQLDEFEQNNIQKAMLWLMGRKLNQQQVLTEAFILALHKRMLGSTWQWAGTLRKSNKNIGVDKYAISLELRQLLDDCTYWVENTTYPPEEVAIRFKHRLVSIHCFPNGNGRHSRLMADVLIEKLFGQEPFSWGAGGNNAPRAAYLSALRAADKNDYGPLILFARS